MMDNFYKKIQEELENQPEMPFEKGAWLDMNNKLATYKEPKSSRRFLIWPFLLTGTLLLLLGTAMFTYFNSGTKLNSTLTKPSTEAETITSRDLVKKSLNRLDTIKSTSKIKTLPAPIPPEVTSLFLPRVPTQYLPSSISAKRSHSNFIQKDTFQSTKTIADLEKYNNSITSFSKNKTSSPAIEKLKISRLNFLAKNSSFSAPAPSIAGVTKSEEIPIPVKKHLQVGMRAGPQWILIDEIDTQLGIYGTLFAQYRLIPSIEVWGEVSALKLTYQTPKEQKSLGIPEWVPASPEQTLTETRVNRIGFDYSGGASYVHRVGCKGTFKVGLGAGGRLWEPYSVIYGFTTENPGEEEEYEEEEHEIFENLDSEFFLQLRTGYTHRISPKVTWEIQANYQPAIPDDEVDESFPAMFGVHTGLSIQLDLPRIRLKKK